SGAEAKEAKETLDLINRALPLLREGRPARVLECSPDEKHAFSRLGLLSWKPVLYVCNVDEASAAGGNAYSTKVEQRARQEVAVAVAISAKIESEIAVLHHEERDEYLEAIGLTVPGLNRLILA